MAVVVKICCTCKLEKNVSDFSLCKTYKDGLKKQCKSCVKAYTDKTKEQRKNRTSIYRALNAEKIKQEKHLYGIKNRDKLKEISKKYYHDHKDILLEKNRQWAKKIESKKLIKDYLIKNHDLRLSKRRVYIEKNKEHITTKQKEYYYNNREEKLKKIIAYAKMRKEKYPLIKVKEVLRLRILAAFKSNAIKKKTSTVLLLGCSVEEAKKHVENQFKEGMSWSNHGINTWHIDHIIPISSAKTEEGLKKLFHYKNLQPLWAIDNLKKGKSICQ